MAGRGGRGGKLSSIFVHHKPYHFCHSSGQCKGKLVPAGGTITLLHLWSDNLSDHGKPVLAGVSTLSVMFSQPQLSIDIYRKCFIGKTQGTFKARNTHDLICHIGKVATQ